MCITSLRGSILETTPRASMQYLIYLKLGTLHKITTTALPRSLNDNFILIAAHAHFSLSAYASDHAAGDCVANIRHSVAGAVLLGLSHGGGQGDYVR